MIGTRIAYDDGMSSFTGIVVEQTENYIDVAFDCDGIKDHIPSTRIDRYKECMDMGFISILDHLTLEMKDRVVMSFCNIEEHTDDVIDMYFLTMFGDPSFIK